MALRGGPGIASPRTSPTSELVRDCDGSSADQLPSEKPSVKQIQSLPLKTNSTNSYRESESHGFRDGGKHREEEDDDTDSHDAGPLSESELFPSPCGSTFSTAATDVPSFNPTFDTTTACTHQ